MRSASEDDVLDTKREALVEVVLGLARVGKRDGRRKLGDVFEIGVERLDLLDQTDQTDGLHLVEDVLLALPHSCRSRGKRRTGQIRGR